MQANHDHVCPRPASPTRLASVCAIAQFRAGARLGLVVASLAASAMLLGSDVESNASASAGAAHAGPHSICSGTNAAKVPCRFSTPSGNIRCVWTPKPNDVACVLRANGRAFRLRPTGRAKSISLKLAQPGKTLPLNQQLIFPDSLSCRDTRRTMVCNQDFGAGAFTLAPGHSRGS